MDGPVLVTVYRRKRKGGTPRCKRRKSVRRK
jgi:hypothetical protein